MRSNGLATILLLIPVLAVPGMAIFGIPQFAPVVTSPLDEGHDFDRETRVGSAERPAQDELFGDFDGFGSETQAKDDAPPEGRTSPVAIKNPPKSTPKRTKQSKFPKGSSDWDSENEWPERNSQPAAIDSPGLGEKTDASAMANSSTQSRPVHDQLPPPQKRPVKRDKSLQQASAVDDFSSSVVDNAEKSEPPRRLPKQGEPRGGGARRAPAKSDPLTWKTAIAKLNELDIHDFRIEPSYESNQFVFTCWYTPPNGSRVSYRFEAEAEEPLKAIEKALEQIIQRQQQQ